jgi:Tfp pilus assembly protein PilO
MAAKIPKNPLTQSLFVFVLCVVGVMTFLILIILPSQKTSAELDREIDKLNVRIEEQRILTPVFHSLLKRAKTAPPSMLPSPEKTKLTHGDMNSISKVFQDIAVRHNLKLEEFKTDVSSVMEDSGYLMMRLRLSGNFYKFRDFLVDLGSIPSLEHIEEVSIRPVKTARELQIKLWLGQEG